MVKRIILLISLFAISFLTSYGQTVNMAPMDSTDFRFNQKVTIEGYIDLYYAYSFNDALNKEQPYFVSMARTNEVSMNLAFVDLKYSSSRLRARLVPGFGTYINANYSNETGSLKNMVEASVGIKLFSKRNIWIDGGVLGSPYTNESAISKDQLTYTRSLAAEYVPYYLTGIKLTLPVSGKVNAYLYYLNGWQQIQNQNNSPALGTQLEYKLNDCWLINWNTYVGKNRSASDSTSGSRYFTDVYFSFTGKKLSATSCAYIGLQQQAGNRLAKWWQVNLIGRCNITRQLSATARVEYFNDADDVQIIPITGVNGFRTYSSSLGLNYKLAENILLRVEGRAFFSDSRVFLQETLPVKGSNTITSNVTIWF